MRRFLITVILTPRLVKRHEEAVLYYSIQLLIYGEDPKGSVRCESKPLSSNNRGGMFWGNLGIDSVGRALESYNDAAPTDLRERLSTHSFRLQGPSRNVAACYVLIYHSK